MKLIRADKERFTFSLGERENALFLQALEMFPLVPPAHHQLSKTGTKRAEDQSLLDEAVAEQRNENVRRIHAFLGEPSRFQENRKEIKLSLTRVEIEWLLQVFNDIRVGAWLALGEPEEIHLLKANAENTRYLFAMEISGYFQVALLAALGHDETSYFQ